MSTEYISAPRCAVFMRGAAGADAVDPNENRLFDSAEITGRYTLPLKFFFETI